MTIINKIINLMKFLISFIGFFFGIYIIYLFIMNPNKPGMFVITFFAIIMLIASMHYFIKNRKKNVT